MPSYGYLFHVSVILGTHHADRMSLKRLQESLSALFRRLASRFGLALSPFENRLSVRLVAVESASLLQRQKPVTTKTAEPRTRAHDNAEDQGIDRPEHLGVERLARLFVRSLRFLQTTPEKGESLLSHGSRIHTTLLTRLLTEWKWNGMDSR